VVGGVVVFVLATGCGGVVVGEGANEGDKGQSAAEWVACSTTMAVGDVASVRKSAEEGNIVVTFEVTEWLKPARGDRRITLDVVDPGTHDDQQRVKAGQHLLIAVPERDDQALGVVEGDGLALQRRQIKKYLDEAETTACPSPWKAG
jgi:hypothetical protein